MTSYASTSANIQQYKAGPRLREGCRQVEAEVVEARTGTKFSKPGNSPVRTWYASERILDAYVARLYRSTRTSLDSLTGMMREKEASQFSPPGRQLFPLMHFLTNNVPKYKFVSVFLSCASHTKTQRVSRGELCHTMWLRETSYVRDDPIYFCTCHVEKLS